MIPSRSLCFAVVLSFMASAFAASPESSVQFFPPPGAASTPPLPVQSGPSSTTPPRALSPMPQRLPLGGSFPIFAMQDTVPSPMPQPPQAVPQYSAEQIPPGMAVPAAPKPVCLADLEGMAMANNPTLARANARVQAAQGNWKQVGLLPNPTGGYSASEIGDEGQAGQQGGVIGQEIVLGHKLKLNRRLRHKKFEKLNRNEKSKVCV